ncbi:hypothetical protein [Microcoleus sp. FACHB-68]|nr:hypothetical protein [Microcoleus sp. FACHB-68]MBD1940462.1 hypothetical protein [Microcoleus sp. FACHB-68]
MPAKLSGAICLDGLADANTQTWQWHERFIINRFCFFTYILLRNVKKS